MCMAQVYRQSVDRVGRPTVEDGIAYADTCIALANIVNYKCLNWPRQQGHNIKIGITNTCPLPHLLTMPLWLDWSKSASYEPDVCLLTMQTLYGICLLSLCPLYAGTLGTVYTFSRLLLHSCIHPCCVLIQVW